LNKNHNLVFIFFKLADHHEEVHDEDVEFSRACPSTDYLFPGNNNFAETIR
jgi:hypothetical protein